MSSLSEPQLVAAFREFCRHTDFFADFEESESDLPEHAEVLEILVGSPEKAATFEVIGHTGSGSYIAFWQEQGTTLEGRPISWLDSEGRPRGVFAQSFAEFLTLLPYGTDLVATILYQCDAAHTDPADAPLDVAELTQEYVPGCVANMQEYYPTVSEYEKWLTQTAGLVAEAQPVERIIQAYRSHTNIEDWRAS